MGTVTKTFVILNLVFSVAFVMVSATVLSQRAHWKTEYNIVEKKFAARKTEWETTKLELENDLDGLGRQKETLTGRITGLDRDVSDRDQTLKRKDGLIQSLKQSEAEIKASSVRLADERGRLNGDLRIIRQKLDSTTVLLRGAETKVDSRNELVMILHARIANLVVMQKDLLQKLDVADHNVKRLQEYEKIVASLDPDVAKRAAGIAGSERVGDFAAGPIHCAVKAVDMGIGVIVLNVGTDSRPPVKAGHTFLIHRKGDFVAAVRVTTVHKRMCAAQIIAPPPESDVRVGDRAVTKFGR